MDGPPLSLLRWTANPRNAGVGSAITASSRSRRGPASSAARLGLVVQAEVFRHVREAIKRGLAMRIAAASEPPVAQLPDGAAEALNEVAVVGDGQDWAREVGQCLLQRL